jgi:hypothetical protein
MAANDVLIRNGVGLNAAKTMVAILVALLG